MYPTDSDYLHYKYPYKINKLKSKHVYSLWQDGRTKHRTLHQAKNKSEAITRVLNIVYIYYKYKNNNVDM